MFLPPRGGFGRNNPFSRASEDTDGERNHSYWVGGQGVNEISTLPSHLISGYFSNLLQFMFFQNGNFPIWHHETEKGECQRLGLLGNAVENELNSTAALFQFLRIFQLLFPMQHIGRIFQASLTPTLHKRSKLWAHMNLHSTSLTVKSAV